MRDYSEFVQFIIKKTGLNKPLLIERDILLHSLLYRLTRDTRFRENYLFKGGSCLVKCYFGYYRFSVDLDFTYLHQERWKGLSRSKRRRELVSEAEYLAELIKEASEGLSLEFTANIENKRFAEFGSGSRLVTFKLYYRGELLKIQVNLAETLLFKPQKRRVRTLLEGVSMSSDERVYFTEYLEEYRGFRVLAYDLREMLCEKVRAILTRRVQKLRDFYDLYVLEKAGLSIEDFSEEIMLKLKPVMRYKKYREAFERNRESFTVSPELITNTYELSLFVEQPNKEEFVEFLTRIEKKLKEIIEEYPS